jgi:hypothetical protein
VSGGPGSRPIEPDQPLDDGDAQLLARLEALWRQVDPVPPALTRRVGFAIDLTRLDVEVARLVQAERETLVRGGRDSRTVTFETRDLAVMVRVAEDVEGMVRLDGWLAPPAPHRVSVRGEGGERVVTADADGRFTVPVLPRGLAQLVITPAAGSALRREVVTPTFEL